MGKTSTIEVLYEDNHLIAVFKPHRVLTQGDETGDESLFEDVKAYIKERDGKPGNVFLGLLHRLDRPAAGVVLFAKTSKGASRISEQFRNREVKKIYRAIIEGVPGKEKAHLVHQIDTEKGKRKAELDYELLRTNEEISLVEVELHTGRKHQIRIQMSEIGHPLLGDSRYGAKSVFYKGAIALLAYEIRFRHPVKQDEWITVTLPDKFGTFREISWKR